MPPKKVGTTKENTISPFDDNALNLTVSWNSIINIIFIVIRECSEILIIFWQWLHSWSSVFYDTSEKEDVINWLKARLSNVPSDFSESWKNGILLCTLLENLIPGCCPRPDLLDCNQSYKNVSKALEIIEHLDISPDVTADDITNCSKNTTKQLLNTLLKLKKKSESLPYKELKEKSENIQLKRPPPEVQACFAKGTGLAVGFLKRPARFTIFCESMNDLDIVIEVKGPENITCCERITTRSPKLKRCIFFAPKEATIPKIKRSVSLHENETKEDEENMTIKENIQLEYELTVDRIFVDYIPIHTGEHKITILWHGQHIPGSPYHVSIESTFEKLNINKTVQLKSSLRNRNFSNDNSNSEKPNPKCRKQSVRFKDSEVQNSKYGKVRKRKVLKYIVKINNKDVDVDVERSDMLAPALLKLDYELERGPVCHRRNSWGFAGDVERKKSFVRQFGVDLEDKDLYGSQRRSSSFNIGYNTDLKRVLPSQDFSHTSNINPLGLMTVSEGTDKEFRLEDKKCMNESFDNISKNLFFNENCNTESIISPSVNDINTTSSKLFKLAAVDDDNRERKQKNQDFDFCENFDDLNENLLFEKSYSEDTAIIHGEKLTDELIKEDSPKIHTLNDYKFSEIKLSNEFLNNNSWLPMQFYEESANCEKNVNCRQSTESLQLITQKPQIHSTESPYTCENTLKIQTNPNKNSIGHEEPKHPLNKIEEHHNNILHNDTCNFENLESLKHSYIQDTYFSKKNRKRHATVTDINFLYLNLKQNTMKSNKTKPQPNPHSKKRFSGFRPKKYSGFRPKKYSGFKPKKHSRISQKTTKSVKKDIYLSNNEKHNLCNKSECIIEQLNSWNSDQNLKSPYILQTIRNGNNSFRAQFQKQHILPSKTEFTEHEHSVIEYINKKSLPFSKDLHCDFDGLSNCVDQEQNVQKNIHRSNSVTDFYSDLNSCISKTSTYSKPNTNLVNTCNNSQVPSFTFQYFKERGKSFSHLSLRHSVKDIAKNFEMNSFYLLNDDIEKEKNLYSRSLNFPPLAANEDRVRVRNRILQWETTSSLPSTLRKNANSYKKYQDEEKLSILADVQSKTIFWESTYNSNKIQAPKFLKDIESLQKPKKANSLPNEISHTNLININSECEIFKFDKDDVGSFNKTGKNYSKINEINNIKQKIYKHHFRNQQRKQIHLMSFQERRASDPGYLVTFNSDIKLPLKFSISSDELWTLNSVESIQTTSNSTACSRYGDKHDSGDEYIDDEIPDYAAMFSEDFTSNADILFDTSRNLLLTNADEIRVFGSGIYFGYVSVKNYFQVLTKSAGKGHLSVSVQGSSLHDVINVSVTYTRKDIYNVAYQVMEPGYYLISVRWSDVSVPGSPFVCKITY